METLSVGLSWSTWVKHKQEPKPIHKDIILTLALSTALDKFLLLWTFNFPYMKEE